MSSIKTTQIDGDVSVGRNVAMGGNAEIAGRVHIGHNLKVDGWLDAPNIISGNKGVFLTLDALRAAYPEPRDGWLAGVGASTPFSAYTGIGGEWVATGGTIDITVDMSEYTEAIEQLQEYVEDIATELQSQSDGIAGLNTAIAGKQDKLTFDPVPTPDSANSVNSGTVATAITPLEVQFVRNQVPANTLGNVGDFAILIISKTNHRLYEKKSSGSWAMLSNYKWRLFSYKGVIFKKASEANTDMFKVMPGTANAKHYVLLSSNVLYPSGTEQEGDIGLVYDNAQQCDHLAFYSGGAWSYAVYQTIYEGDSFVNYNGEIHVLNSAATVEARAGSLKSQIIDCKYKTASITGLGGNDGDYAMVVVSATNNRLARNFNGRWVFQYFYAPNQLFSFGGNLYRKSSHQNTDLFLQAGIGNSDWVGKTLSTYGDSVVAINNGDFAEPFIPSDAMPWGNRVADYFAFSAQFGRGIGGQRLAWGSNGGSVAFINADGTLNSRNDSYNYDNYVGHVPVPAGTTPVRGCLCSWLRITTMYPESMKDSVDCIFIMCHNDLGAEDIPLAWQQGSTADPEWAASETYSTYGGDYNINSLRGGVASLIMKLQAWMPQAVIVMGTPVSGRGETGALNPTNTDVLYDVSQQIKDVAEQMSIPIIDVYATDGINGLNRTQYIQDAIHPYLDAGKKMLARAVIGGLKTILPML